jgi:hypothetical protein
MQAPKTYKLSPGGQFVPAFGPTPEIDRRLIHSIGAKTARGAYRAKGGGCIGGAALTKTIYASADRRNLLNYATKGMK